MTSKQFRSIAKYIVQTAAEYGLRDWEIVVHEGVEDESAAAHVNCIYGRRIAHVNITPDFDKLAPEEQRRVILHELTHIHLDQVSTLIEEALPTLIGMPAYNAFSAGYKQAMEHATDAIADAIGDRYVIWEG